MKFRKDRPEEACPKAIPDKEFAAEGGLACMRIAGHPGDCIATVSDAALADGVCGWCRNPLGTPHEADCRAGAGKAGAEGADTGDAGDATDGYPTDGYPTPDELAKIRAWPWADPLGLFAYIKERWHLADWGWSEERDDGNKSRWFKISTAGWSGNEDIIAALTENSLVWTFFWHSSRRGGHYEFEVKDSMLGTPAPGTL